MAGFRAWLKLGYCVCKGEKAIRVVAPMPIKRRETEIADGDDETRVLFKGVSVFDRPQVAPIDGMTQALLEPPSKPLTGDSHAHLLEPTRTFAQSLGFTVSFEAVPGATGGWCDQKMRRIVVDADQPANAQLRIRIHETIHGLGVGYAEYGRARAEVIVDTAIFCPGRPKLALEADRSVRNKCHGRRRLVLVHSSRRRAARLRRPALRSNREQVR